LAKLAVASSTPSTHTDRRTRRRPTTLRSCITHSSPPSTSSHLDVQHCCHVRHCRLGIHPTAFPLAKSPRQYPYPFHKLFEARRKRSESLRILSDTVTSLSPPRAAAPSASASHNSRHGRIAQQRTTTSYARICDSVILMPSAAIAHRSASYRS
ncbi:hypothetical protein PHBOTO_004232, partial [Pseudozyma hubeiensis]